MTDALYERYKDALRRGHVAAIRERFDAALVAYSEAAEIAPERALPHSSLGGVLARLGRREEALAAYGRALDRAPRDEGSLSGRAGLLAALGRPADAAADLDLLADTREEAGKLAEASDTVLQALRLAESRARRRHLEAIVRQLRDMPDEATAEAALERALGVVEPGPTEQAAETAAERMRDALTQPTGATEPAESTLATAEAPEPLPDGALLTVEAEELLDAGDAIGAQQRLLLAARSHHVAGRLSAALDACYLALGVAPFDLELHILLTELYLEQGWRTPAADKLVLLGRLVDLADDAAGRARICALASERFPDDERLVALCA
jgi:tetratricopeptide (TPR) repeat protein